MSRKSDPSGASYAFILADTIFKSRASIAFCSVKGISTILVFWDGSENNPAALAPWKGSNYVQNVGGGRWGYSRIIEPMGMADIVRYHDLEHLGIPLPPIDHQGIDDGFEGKAFLVWYYYDGQWLKEAGED